MPNATYVYYTSNPLHARSAVMAEVSSTFQPEGGMTDVASLFLCG